MSTTVPERRVTLVEGEVAISESVRSVSWVHAAQLHQWIAGRGGTVVPTFRPFTPSGLGFEIGSSYFFRFEPRYQDTRYLLKLLLFSHGLDRHPLTVTVPVGGTEHEVTVGQLSTGGAPSELEFEIDVAAQSGRETELSFRIKDNDNGEWGIMAVAIDAVPRTALTDDASDLGVDRLRFWPRGPVSDPNIAKLLGRQNELKAAGRRVGMWHHAFGSAEDHRVGVTSASFVDVLEDAAPALGRLLYSGETTRTLHWRVCAYCSDATTAGEVSIASTSGGSDTITIPAGMTTIGWAPYAWSSPGEITVDAEDPTTATGLRGGAWDDLTVQARRTAGSGTIYILGISVWEPSEGLLSVPVLTGARTAGSAWMADPRAGWAFEAADTAVSMVGVGQPRVFRDGAILIEGSRTNLLPDSADLADAGWTAFGTPVRSTGGGGPDGSTSYVYADDNGGSTESYYVDVSVSASTTYTASVYVRKETAAASYARLRLDASVGAEDWGYHIDAQNGTLTREGSMTLADSTQVTDAGDWWRVAITVTTGAGETGLRFYFDPARATVAGTGTAAATGSVEAWGFQLEAGAFASSPIATTTAGGVTRGDDNFSFSPGTEITEGAWSVTVCPAYSSSDAPSAARILYYNVNTQLALISGTTLRLVANAVSYDITGLSFSALEEATITVDFAAGSMTLSGWGGGSVAIGNDWSTATDLYIGALDDGTEAFFGTISRPVAA